MNHESVLSASHPQCNANHCAQLGLLCHCNLHVTKVTPRRFTHCTLLSSSVRPLPQQPQSRLTHSHTDCFPSVSNNKSIRAGLASGKLNQSLFLSQDEDLKWSVWTFLFPSFVFPANQQIPSLLISLPVGIYQMFLLLTYCQKSSL